MRSATGPDLLACAVVNGERPQALDPTPKSILYSRNGPPGRLAPRLLYILGNNPLDTGKQGPYLLSMTKRSPRAPIPTHPTAVAHIRVSKDEELQANGVEGQRAAIAAWALREGVELIAERVETITGGAPLHERLVLLDSLAIVADRKATFLVVAKLDRYSRDPVTAALAGQELSKAGASLAVADGNGEGEDPTSKLVRGILLAVAEFERAMIRARIVTALEVKRTKGELTGKAPYGTHAVDGPLRLRRDGSSTPLRVLEDDQDEQSTIMAARALSAQGLSIRKVIVQLAKDGKFNRAGKPFTVRAMWAILSGAPKAD